MHYLLRSFHQLWINLCAVSASLSFHFSLLCVSPCDWLVIFEILPLSHCRLPISLSFKSSGSDPLFAVTFTQAELGLALRGAGLKGSLCLGEEKCSHLAERWPGSDDGGWQGGCSDCCLALQKPTTLALIEAVNEANLLTLNPRSLWGFGNTSEQRWVNCSLCCLVAAFFLTCPWIPVIRESGNAFQHCSMAFFYFGTVDLCQIRGLEQVHNH